MFNTTLDDDPASAARSGAAIEQKLESLDDFRVSTLVFSHNPSVAAKCIALLAERIEHTTGIEFPLSEVKGFAGEVLALQSRMK